MTEFHIKAIIRKKTLQRNLAFKESQVQLTRSSIIEVVTAAAAATGKCGVNFTDFSGSANANRHFLFWLLIQKTQSVMSVPASRISTSNLRMSTSTAYSPPLYQLSYHENHT